MRYFIPLIVFVLFPVVLFAETINFPMYYPNKVSPPSVGDKMYDTENDIMYRITGDFTKLSGWYQKHDGDLTVWMNQNDMLYVWKGGYDYYAGSSKYEIVLDDDNDGVENTLDPYPSVNGTDDQVKARVDWYNCTSKNSIGSTYIFQNTPGSDIDWQNTSSMKTSHTGGASSQLMTDYNDGLTENVCFSMDETVTWSDYQQAASGSPDSLDWEKADFDQMNYMDYVNNTPEPVRYDSDVSSNSSSYRDSNATSEDSLRNIEAHNQQNLKNQEEIASYLKSIDAQLRKGHEVAYGGPSAEDIGAAVASNMSSSDGGGGNSTYGGPSADEIGAAVASHMNGTFPTADEIAEKNRNKIVGNYTEPDGYRDLLPDDPGHGHGNQDLNGSLSYFEQKLNEWFNDWQSSEAQDFFNGTYIKYTSPDPVFCIGSISVAEGYDTGDMCTDFSSWSGSLTTIGEILYACVAIWWGLWVFRRGD